MDSDDPSLLHTDHKYCSDELYKALLNDTSYTYEALVRVEWRHLLMIMVIRVW
jgi:hypothetical protein